MAKKKAQKKQSITGKDLGEKYDCCIHCGSVNISAEEFDDSGLEGSRNVNCDDCGKSQTEVWTLTTIESN